MHTPWGRADDKTEKAPVKPRMQAIETDKLELLEECARYIVEFEQSNFEDVAYTDEDCDLENHVFAKAFRALYGDREWTNYLAGLRE